MRRFIFLFLFVLCLAASSFAATQQFPTVSVTVVTTQDLAINSNNVTIPTPLVEDYNAGWTQTASNVLTVKSNVPWILNVKSDSVNLSNGKLLADLQWERMGSGADFNSFTTADCQVHSGVATGGTVVTVNYRMKLLWASDGPGLYTANLVYTLVTDEGGV